MIRALPLKNNTRIFENVEPTLIGVHDEPFDTHAEVAAPDHMPIEADGELVGWTPAVWDIAPGALLFHKGAASDVGAVDRGGRRRPAAHPPALPDS